VIHVNCRQDRHHPTREQTQRRRETLTALTEFGEHLAAKLDARDAGKSERGFRVLKSDIEIAPVYHYKPDRIRAHAMICFFALLLHRVMRLRLRQKDSTFSVERALEKLRGIQLHRVQIGKKRLRGLTKMTPEQLGLFEALEAKKPAADAL